MEQLCCKKNILIITKNDLFLKNIELKLNHANNVYLYINSAIKNTEFVNSYKIVDGQLIINNNVININNIKINENISTNIIDKIIDLCLYFKCNNLIVDENYFDEQKNIYIYEKYNIHLLSYFENNIQFISDIELSNILNFKKLIVFSYQNFSIGTLVNYIRDLFENKANSLLFLKNGLKIIMEQCDKKGILENVSYIHERLYEIEKNINNYKNTILFGISKNAILNIGSYAHFADKKNRLENNIKLICWYDDLHMLGAHIGFSSLTNTNPYNCEWIDKLDYILSPSLIYYKNINMKKYYDKMIDFFYILPPTFANICYKNFDSRQSKIILSGCVEQHYKTRHQFLNLSKTNDFKNIIDHYSHPGYTESKNVDSTKLGVNYYNKLSDYKGAFVGHCMFPLNFLLAKHIETLMCGCLGFFEQNPLLESQLGLKAFEHYIPCCDDFGNIIKDKDFYIYWIKNGKDIASNGTEYVKTHFGDGQLYKLINIFKNL